MAGVGARHRPRATAVGGLRCDARPAVVSGARLPAALPSASPWFGGSVISRHGPHRLAAASLVAEVATLDPRRGWRACDGSAGCSTTRSQSPAPVTRSASIRSSVSCPGIGDLIGGVFSLYIIVEAARIGVPTRAARPHGLERRGGHAGRRGADPRRPVRHRHSRPTSGTSRCSTVIVQRPVEVRRTSRRFVALLVVGLLLLTAGAIAFAVVLVPPPLGTRSSDRPPAEPSVYSVAIFVHDIGRAIEFYRDRLALPLDEAGLVRRGVLRRGHSNRGASSGAPGRAGPGGTAHRDHAATCRTCCTTAASCTSAASAS